MSTDHLLLIPKNIVVNSFISSGVTYRTQLTILQVFCLAPVYLSINSLPVPDVLVVSAGVKPMPIKLLKVVHALVAVHRFGIFSLPCISSELPDNSTHVDQLLGSHHVRELAGCGLWTK